MSQPLMKRQWQEMALRNPFFSITSWPEFEDENALDRDFFWQIGAIHARNLLAKVPLGDTRDLTMVEIGCGMGRMTHYFASRFSKVRALDISAAMIERARQFWGGLSNVEFLEVSGVDLSPIENTAADFVLSFYVLNHITEADTVLGYVRETARVLKSNGLALLHMRVGELPPLDPALLKSRLRGLLRSRSQGYWWNEGIQRRASGLRTDISDRFMEKEAWLGCEVPWREVKQTLHDCGLRPLWTDIASTPQTHFAFLVLRKDAPV